MINRMDDDQSTASLDAAVELLRLQLAVAAQVSYWLDMDINATRGRRLKAMPEMNQLRFRLLKATSEIRDKIAQVQDQKMAACHKFTILDRPRILGLHARAEGSSAGGKKTINDRPKYRSRL